MPPCNHRHLECCANAAQIAGQDHLRYFATVEIGYLPQADVTDLTEVCEREGGTAEEADPEECRIAVAVFVLLNPNFYGREERI